MAQRVKDLVLPQLWHRLQLQLGFDSWSVELPYAAGAAKKKKKKKKKKKSVLDLTLSLGLHFLMKAFMSHKTDKYVRILLLLCLC